MCWTATVALHASFRTAVFTSRAFQPGADLFDGEVAWVGYPPAGPLAVVGDQDDGVLRDRGARLEKRLDPVPRTDKLL